MLAGNLIWQIIMHSRVKSAPQKETICTSYMNCKTIVASVMKSFAQEDSIYERPFVSLSTSKDLEGNIQVQIDDEEFPAIREHGASFSP